MHALAEKSYDSFKQQLRVTFAALGVRNYRLFFIGQGISLSGTWMQTVAQGWLVLQLTGSGTQVGFVVAAQFLPLLFFTPVGGMIADRYPKRKVLLITQTLFTVVQLSLGLVVIFHVVQLWMIYVLALAFGLVNAIDNPTRQAFVSELVDREYVRNAVTLNATENNLARAVGPSLGAIVIATLGIGFCFIANSFTTLAVIIALQMMDLNPVAETENEGRVQIRPLQNLKEAWQYARKAKLIREILILAVIIGTFSYEFQISLPILAKFAFATDASSYSRLWVAFGLGSVVGGLLAAGRTAASVGYLVRSAVLFGLCMLAVAVMPTLNLAVLGMLLVGFFSINFTSLANTMLQLEADDEHRGRVMSLWTMAMLGSTPIGGPIIGSIAEHLGARWGIATGGIAAVFAGLFIIRKRFQTETLLAIPAYIKTSIFRFDAEEEAKLR
jgi:MFS family permease